MLDTPLEVYNTVVLRCEEGDVDGLRRVLRHVVIDERTADAIVHYGVVDCNLEMLKLGIQYGAISLHKARAMAHRRKDENEEYKKIHEYLEMEVYHRA